MLHRKNPYVTHRSMYWQVQTQKIARLLSSLGSQESAAHLPGMPQGLPGSFKWEESWLDVASGIKQFVSGQCEGDGEVRSLVTRATTRAQFVKPFNFSKERELYGAEEIHCLGGRP